MIFLISLEFIILSRSLPIFFKEIINSIWFYHILDKFLTITCSMSPIALSSNICIFSWDCLCQHKLLGFVEQLFLKCLWSSFHKIQSYYIILNHFHLNMCEDQGISTLPCLHPPVELGMGSILVQSLLNTYHKQLPTMSHGKNMGYNP